MGPGLMRTDGPSNSEVRQDSDPGSLADVYRVIDSLKGRSLEEELAGLRRARMKLLAAVPGAADRARLARIQAEGGGTPSCDCIYGRVGSEAGG